MELLLDIFGFLSVVLHGLTLTAQATTLGGIAFLLCLSSPLQMPLGSPGTEILRRSRQLIAWSAAILALVCTIEVTLKIIILQKSLEIPWSEAMGANFALAGIATVIAAVLIALLCRAPLHRRNATALVALTLVILAAAITTTHAVARLENRLAMAAVGVLHLAGAAIWIGGMPYFLITLARCEDGLACRLVGKRFSQMSMVSVAAIAIAGLIMAYVYIGDWAAVYGTAYGVMTSTKVVIFLCLLGLGVANYRLVERLRQNPSTPVLRMRRFAEVELGVGLTVFLVAASLTSLPPAVDLPRDRATRDQIIERVLTFKAPRLVSPSHSDLAIPALQAKLDQEAAAEARETIPPAFVPGAGVPPPRNAFDVAWSEYNHHWAGVFVLVIGLLALAERAGWAPWARHWPLAFVALSAFLIVRSDPETWPLGDIGFWESFRDPEVVQQRLLVSLVGVFGIFEWRARVGTLANTRAVYVFPLICVIGGALLFSHSHQIANPVDQLLIEMTHTPLALFGLTAGWARWLELRTEAPVKTVSAWVWPVCFALVGLVLLSYREA